LGFYCNLFYGSPGHKRTGLSLKQALKPARSTEGREPCDDATSYAYDSTKMLNPHLKPAVKLIIRVSIKKIIKLKFPVSRKLEWGLKVESFVMDFSIRECHRSNKPCQEGDKITQDITRIDYLISNATQSPDWRFSSNFNPWVTADAITASA
jgi:hypothetical protein